MIIGCLSQDVHSQGQNNPYPDLDENIQFANYADGGGQQYHQQQGQQQHHSVYYDYVDYDYHGQQQQEQYQNVVYDYVDHYEAANDGYMNNRYYIDEKVPTEYDYDGGMDKYRKVGEGTEGTYTEMGGWHYEPRHDSHYRNSYDSYGGYDSYGYVDGYGDVHHHHHHHYDGERGFGSFREYNSQGSRGRYEHRGNESETNWSVVLALVILVVALVALCCAYAIYQEGQRKERVQKNLRKVKSLQNTPDAPIESSEPISFQGPCYVDGPVSDPMFGIVTKEHPIMYREVEVYCWVERIENVEERHGNQVRRGKKYHYTTQWVKDFVNSSGFKDQKYNQNVRPDVNSEVLQGGAQVRVGPFYTVDIHELEKGFGLTKLKNVVKHGQISAEFNRNGIWQYDKSNSCIVRQRNPGKDTIGDIRVSYRVLNQFDQIGTQVVRASVCGVPKGNRITKWSKLNGSVLSGSVGHQQLMDKLTK